jgi:hypothetical protein
MPMWLNKAIYFFCVLPLGISAMIILIAQPSVTMKLKRFSGNILETTHEKQKA